MGVHLKKILRFLFSRYKQNRIVTKTILGITFRYVRGKDYNELINFVEYIEPYLKSDISDLKADLQNKLKKYIVFVNAYEKDLEKIKLYVDEVNPVELSKAEGVLRETQLRNLSHAKEVLSEIEDKTGIKLFMDDGTLLGAVRHGGFIPWDDDMDFSVMRKDYEKLLEYIKTNCIYVDSSDWCWRTKDEKLKECFEKYKNQKFWVRFPYSLKCYQGTFTERTWFDVFALDYYSDDINTEIIREYSESVKERIMPIRMKERYNKGQYKKYFDFYDRERIDSKLLADESETIAPGIDNYDFTLYTIKDLRRKTDVFPLVKLKFEDGEFYAPNDSERYLKSIYNYYKKMPLDIDIARHSKTKTMK